MTQSLDLLRCLARTRAEFVLVGGMAGVVHGSSMVTRDLDVCARPTPENVARLLEALRALHPRDGRTETAPPLQRTAQELAESDDFSIETDAGRLDVIWDVPGVGAWAQAAAAAQSIDLGDGDVCMVLGLDALIASKRALGRTRDILAVEELEEIRRRLREPR